MQHFLQNNWLKIGAVLGVLLLGAILLNNTDNNDQSSIEEIKSSPFYEACTSEAIKESNKLLLSYGYTEQDDGSWQDSQGHYPTSEHDQTAGELLNEVFFNCLDKKEEAAQDAPEFKSVVKKYVSVKYRSDPVDISSFEHLDTSKSSWVRGAWYDSGNKYMIINLSGTNYHYCSMPNSVWRNFKSASSFGSHYNGYIKGNYDCRVYPIPEY